MTDHPRDDLDGLIGTIESALGELLLGALDGPLPNLEAAGSERYRGLVARLSEVIVSQRRAALRLTHVAAAIDTAVGEVRDRIRIAAEANADMASSSEGCQSSATELTTSARRVSGQAKDLHVTMASAAEAASRVSASGMRVARDSSILSDAASDAATSAAAIASSMQEIDRALGALAAEHPKTTSAVSSIDRSVRDIDESPAETRRH
jgi:methyl-accepting chemotaxis protein